MNREDIIRMAREASPKNHDRNIFFDMIIEDLERFAAIVASAAQAKEREACAKFIEHDYVRQFERPWRDDLSAAIRARGQA